MATATQGIAFELDMTEFDSPAALDAGGAPAAGDYHVVISGQPKTDIMGDDNVLLDCMGVRFQVICGTTPGQERTQFVERFYYPKPQQKDGGSFCRRKLTKLALAAGLISKQSLGQKVNIPWGDLEGQQVVIRVSERKYKKKDGGDGVATEINGLHIYHPLDPRVASVPKDIDLIRDAGLTWDGDPDGGAGANGQGDDGGAALGPANGVANGTATNGATAPGATAQQQVAKPAAAAAPAAQPAAAAAPAVAAAPATAAKPANDPFAGL